jgi:hypothetical protein
MIVKRGNKFLVMDSKGKKVLGTHDSEASAERQLTAIHISQQKNESRIIKFSDFLRESLSTIEYHDTLNSKIWNGFELKGEVRQKLLDIGNEWSHWAKLPLHAIKDYILVGGNANFNYTSKSDIDLHILIDENNVGNCPEFLEDYFNDKKELWKAKHNISIYGHPVEIYAQDVKNKIPKNQGVFSLTKNEWLSKPVHLNLNVNDIDTADVSSKLRNKIDSMLDQNLDSTEVQEFKDKLKKMRGNSLATEGEFGEDNLIFKELRNLGYLDKMNNYIESNRDKKLSL